MKHIFLLALALVGSCGCADAKKSEPYKFEPALDATVLEVVGSTANFTVRSVNNTDCAVLCLLASEEAPSAKTVYDNGSVFEGSTATVSGLDSFKSYVAYFAARDAKKHYSDVFAVRFETAIGADNMYPWEASRVIGPYNPKNGVSGRFEPYDNMALLYGSNMWRTVKKWDADRCSSYVTYTDRQGKETWLFDAFLALEIWNNGTDGNHRACFGIGYGGDSANKDNWTHFLDYWFEDGYGFDALDKAVADAKQRLGEPSTTRKVVVSVPDPIMFKMWNDPQTSSTYWGSINGKVMDFTKGEDRLAACKWFVDEVRRRWYEKGYENIELYGFYCFSEELATLESQWNYQYKKWNQIYPMLSDYVHSFNESMSWIPYNWAMGYDKWESFNFDFAMIQPNYLWHAEYSMKDYKDRLIAANLSMEIEFDNSVLSGSSTQAESRQRFLAYLPMCKELGLYGKSVLSYYLEETAFEQAKKSKDPSDVELYHTLCEFIIGNIRH